MLLYGKSTCFAAALLSLTFLCSSALVSAKPIPEPTKSTYPGTIQLSVDVTDVERKIHRAKAIIPVSAGPLTLLFPQWLPGNHAPNGQVANLSGLIFKANGKTIPWERDTINTFAFHLDIPAGVTNLEAQYEYLTATAPVNGRVLVTPEIINLQWNSVVLYPAGVHASGINVEASMTYPAEWKFATALSSSTVSSNTASAAGVAKFKTVNLEDLIDSPVYVGKYLKTFDLAPMAKVPVRFHVVADAPESLVAAPEHIEAHKKMVQQTYKVFGAGPYDRYEFLIAASENFGGTGGLEHRQSTEIGVGAGYFTKWKDSAFMRGVVPHEFVHAWDGKFRRPADLTTRNYNEPMQDSLLWVYEGQTTYWTDVIAARSGLHDAEEAREALARTVSTMLRRAGRQWRNLQDTTNDAIMSTRGGPKSWPSWQRGGDYYPEALMMWMDADIKIRELTNNAKSLDDFARAFFAVPPGKFDTVTYTFDDVVNTLKAVAPLDWKSFLRARLDATAADNPLDTLGRSGWKLVYTDKPNTFSANANKARGNTDFSDSIGITVAKQDVISEVQWGSPAFAAKIASGSTLVAVNGRAYKSEHLSDAIVAAKDGKSKIELLVKTDDRYRTVSIDYRDGLRYPHLERVEGTVDRLGMIFAPL
jgi:predicted metalloprotease with PDZ domain